MICLSERRGTDLKWYRCCPHDPHMIKMPGKKYQDSIVVRSSQRALVSNNPFSAWAWHALVGLQRLGPDNPMRRWWRWCICGSNCIGQCCEWCLRWSDWVFKAGRSWAWNCHVRKYHTIAVTTIKPLKPQSAKIQDDKLEHHRSAGFRVNEIESVIIFHVLLELIIKANNWISTKVLWLGLDKTGQYGGKQRFELESGTKWVYRSMKSKLFDQQPLHLIYKLCILHY